MSSRARIIMLVAVILLMAIGISIAVIDNRKIQTLKNNCTEVVEGTCITCEYKSGNTRRNRNRGYYLVTASYKANGVPYMAEGRSDRPYEPRDNISVHYDPSDPSKSYTGSAPAPTNNPLPIVMVICMIPLIVLVKFSKRANRYT